MRRKPMWFESLTNSGNFDSSFNFKDPDKLTDPLVSFVSKSKQTVGTLFKKTAARIRMENSEFLEPDQTDEISEIVDRTIKYFKNIK